MIVIDEQKCVGCGQCVADCVFHNLTVAQGKAHVVQGCMQCGHCVAICPVQAVSIPEYEMADIESYDPESFHLEADKVLHAIKFRRSVRRFQDKPIEREKLERLIQAGRYTETAVNHQAVRFIVVQEKLEQFKPLAWEGWHNHVCALKAEDPERAKGFEGYEEIYRKDPTRDRLFFNAPCVIAVASDAPLDGGLASANIEMMAVAQGLGVLFDGFVLRAINHNPAAQEWLGLGDKQLAAVMLVGYPAVSYKRTAPRRAADVLWK